MTGEVDLALQPPTGVCLFRCLKCLYHQDGAEIPELLSSGNQVTEEKRKRVNEILRGGQDMPYW